MELTITRERFPPGPAKRIAGESSNTSRQDSASLLMQMAREYGDIVAFKLGRQDVVLLNHPDYVQDVLVTRHKQFLKGGPLQRAKRLLGEGLLTSEGNYHRQQRRLAQPAFHRARIAGYAHAIAEHAARTGMRWQEKTQVDMAGEMMRLTLGVVSKTLFDADVETEADELAQAFAEALEYYNLVMWTPEATERFARVRHRLDTLVYRLVDERTQSGEDRSDLLSMLLAGQGMTNEQVRDELMTIFVAGHETVANALTWTWYLLSEHPEAEARMHAELRAVLGGRLPSYDDLEHLTYTRQVFAESMRLYPPGWVIGRTAVSEYEVGGYLVPAGTVVLVSQYVMHRDPRYYPDPERFAPDRWTPEAMSSRPKYAYFPFGGGVRQCIGERMAWMEGVLVMATMAQDWRPRLVPGHPVEPRPLVTLRPRFGMQMTLEIRAQL
ncbi:MAG: cytochrome P450 [Chloroflexota bacterium]|nr:cytochrome P450 [Chloroflexota bacterium]